MSKPSLFLINFIYSETVGYELTGFHEIERIERGSYDRVEDFDVYWCKRDAEYIWENVGSCALGSSVEVSGPYWTNRPDLIIEGPANWCADYDRIHNATKRFDRLPFELEFLGKVYAEERLKEYLETAGLEERSTYCSVCQDEFAYERECEHLWWCSENGVVSTPEERFAECQCDGCKKAKEVTA